MQRCTIQLLLILGLLGTVHVYGLGEKVFSRIQVTPYSDACMQHINDRPCPKPRPEAKVEADHLPPDGPCPCPDGSGGGGYPFATGSVSAESDDYQLFTDELLAGDFSNPIGMSFTDNTNELFVGTRAGIVYKIDLATGDRKVFIDLSRDVGMSGDRGLMDVLTSVDFDTTRQVYVAFVIDHNPDDGKEPGPEDPANQRILRLEDKGGVANPDVMVAIMGQGENDGPVACHDSHTIGSLLFGLDNSMVISVGEGAHWDFPIGDFGQDRANPSPDPQCAERFGQEQDVGGFRAQILESLNGKILRIDPLTGDGICPDSASASQYTVYNPFCDGTKGKSHASKVYAMGCRNPFRATIRPLRPGETHTGGPGVIYFGDVGRQGWEEINVVHTNDGPNFGWPCWEGPLYCPQYRDSPYNFSPDPVSEGCAGQGCKGISYYAKATDGSNLNCPYIYNTITTVTPSFYYSRWQEYPATTNYGENANTGQGIYGATIAGLAFYTGNLYPPKYSYALFMLDYSDLWIKIAFFNERDEYISSQHFMELIHTEPIEGSKLTLRAGPDGNLCYITLTGGEVRCIRFAKDNIAPVPIISTDVDSGIAPLTIQFSPDRTYDRERDTVEFLWDFGDGQTSEEPNPKHTFTDAQEYTVTLTATDSTGNAASVISTVYANNERPKVTITSPIPTLPGKIKEFSHNEQLDFKADVVDDDTNLTYEWEFQFVHNNHLHPDVEVINKPTFRMSGSEMPAEGNAERFNLLVILHVTDPSGLEGTDYIRLVPDDFKELFPSQSAPIPSFTYEDGFLPIITGQPVRFNAQDTTDPEGDRMDFKWDFGDGFTSTSITSSHVYIVADVYTVTLNVTDNWGLSAQTQHEVTVLPCEGCTMTTENTDRPPTTVEATTPSTVTDEKSSIGGSTSTESSSQATNRVEDSATSSIHVPALYLLGVLISSMLFTHC